MDFDSLLFLPEEYDKIFRDLTNSNLRGLHHTEIFKRIVKRFGGTIIFTLTLGKEIKELPVYRVTPEYDGLLEKLDFIKSFSYKEKPDLGRANIEGHPVFYCSISAPIAISEMKDFENKEFYISRWRLKFPQRTFASILILDDKNIENSTNGILGRLIQNGINTLTSNFDDEHREWFRYKLKKFGDLFTIEGNEFYHLSSAIAHRFLYDLRKINAYIPVLIYPSITRYSSDFNLAIHPILADNPDLLELESIIKCKVSVLPDKKIQGTFKSKAIPLSNGLIWKHKYISKIKICTKEILIKLSYKLESRIVNPEGIMINSSGIRHDLKEYIVKSYDFIKEHFNYQIGKFMDNHDLFNNELEYKGNTLLIIEFDKNMQIVSLENDYIERIGIKIDYNIKFE